MPLDDYHLRLINDHKRQNECYVLGLMEDGKEGCATEWLTDDQLENHCGRPLGFFKQVTQITLITRHLTSEELVNQANKQPNLRVIHGPHFRVPVITVQ